MDTNQTSGRKKDHIELAFQSQHALNDPRFYYEPLLSAHPGANSIPAIHFSGKQLRLPLWVSSMTGGTEKAGHINKNLAMACAEFGMGMGLGSCRIILDDNTYFSDFDIRQYLGEGLPLYANLGIAQVEQLIADNKIEKITELIKRLKADGLIIHINPLQEWLQPEGDLIKHSPLISLKKLLDRVNFKVIVKEVGQGFGPGSLVELMQLPVEAIEFGAHGGTNFATLELLRQDETVREQMMHLTNIGHTALEMVNFANQIIADNPHKVLCKQLIVSGGIKNYLDGYYLINKAKTTAIYAQASAFLKYATGDYETLRQYCELQQKGLQACYQYLSIRE